MDSDLGFIHRYEPPKNGSSRTILVLHGTGGDENSLVSIAALLDQDAGVLSPRGKILEDGAPRFFRRMAEGIFDLEDLRFRTHELADFVTAASQTYGFSLSDVTAVGYSNGANIAASLFFLRSEILASGVLFRAMVPLEIESKPDLSSRRIFLSEGEHDPLVPATNADHLAYLLRSMGADVTLHWTDLGHQIGREEIEEAQHWLTKGSIEPPL